MSWWKRFVRKIDRILELNRQEKDRTRLPNSIPKMNSLNPSNKGDAEMQLKMELPAPFKIKGLLPKPTKKLIQRLPHYNQELASILEAKHMSTKNAGKPSELYS